MVFAEKFKDLEIWQQAQDLAVRIYQLFGVNTASRGNHCFVGQIQGSAISISNTIAEGYDAGTAPKFARFLRISKRSCAEVRSVLYRAEKFDYLPANKRSRNESMLRYCPSASPLLSAA